MQLPKVASGKTKYMEVYSVILAWFKSRSVLLFSLFLMRYFYIDLQIDKCSDHDERGSYFKVAHFPEAQACINMKQI